jgi:hypothetical protein
MTRRSQFVFAVCRATEACQSVRPVGRCLTRHPATASTRHSAVSARHRDADRPTLDEVGDVTRGGLRSDTVVCKRDASRKTKEAAN